MFLPSAKRPLGEGAEAQVFKIHTNPNFTVRKRLTDMPINELAAALKEAEPVMQPDIFGERNFAQTVAYFNHPKLLDDDGTGADGLPLLSGFSFEVYKPGRPKPDSEEALIKTRLLSEKMLEIPNAPSTSSMTTCITCRQRNTVWTSAAACLPIPATFCIRR